MERNVVVERVFYQCTEGCCKTDFVNVYIDGTMYLSLNNFILVTKMFDKLGVSYVLEEVDEESVHGTFQSRKN